MEAICPICDIEFKDNQPVVAVMLTRFKKIESSSAFAVHHPTRCLEIVHVGCYDDDITDEATEGAN